MAHDLAEATRDAHAQIVDAEIPPETPTGRDWSTASDYARDLLAEHARIAGRLDDLLQDPGFLLITSVPALLGQRHHLHNPNSLAAVGALEMASSSWTTHSDRWKWLAVSARKLRQDALADRVQRAATHRAPEWIARWVLWAGIAHRVLRGHSNSVRALAAVPLPDGSTLLASADDAGMVRLWDPSTATGRGELTGHTGRVRALAAVPLPDGSTLLATAGTDRTVRLWDPTTRSLRGELTGHTYTVQTLAAVPRGECRRRRLLPMSGAC